MSELKRTKEVFIDPLLHPSFSTSVSNTLHLGAALGDSRNHAEYSDIKPLGHLPITSRSIPSPIASRSTTPAIQPTGHDLYDQTLESVSLPTATPPLQLPDDLRLCLEVIERNLLENHSWFSMALKMHWRGQRNLTSSIEDILVDYVCYLLPCVCHHLTVFTSPIF